MIRPVASIVEGQAVRFLACLVVLVVCYLAGPGCALVGKKGSDPKAPAAAPGSGAAPAKFPTNSDPLLNGGNVSQGKPGAVLAGRVIDNFSRPPANTSIRLVAMDSKETSTPTEISVTPEGYFTIPGLKAGADYKLLARGKNGDRLLAGINIARAPNLAVVIQIREDLANSTTPDVPGSPAFQDKNPKTSSLDNPNNFANNNNALPTMGKNGRGGSEYQMPAVNVPGPGRPAPPPSVPANQNWTPGPNVATDKGSIWPPPLEIANPTARPVPPPLQIPRTTPAPEPFKANPLPGSSRLDGPARVPSCVLVGKKLENFALRDVNGEPWEFKTHRRGKLVLLDFWSTNCVPCREAIPSLMQLQSKYFTKGLEVIGIAIETKGSPQDQAYLVSSMAKSMHINYRQLICSGASCPVTSETGFKITAVPTLVLVDHDGTILRRHEGGLDPSALNTVENLIRSKLTAHY